MGRLPAYFLGKQGVYDAMLLAEIFSSINSEKDVYYKPK
jgi:hypothetical protein